MKSEEEKKARQKEYQSNYYLQNKERLTEYKKEYSKRRDYKHEQELEKAKIKRYTVRVPLYMAKALDEKLKNERQNIFKYSY